jgi:hypothetical protein
MFGFLFRVLLIGLIIYFVLALIWGGYGRICSAYYWMWP